MYCRWKDHAASEFGEKPKAGPRSRREGEGARERTREGENAFPENREGARGVVMGITESLMHGTQTGREGKAGLLFQSGCYCWLERNEEEKIRH